MKSIASVLSIIAIGLGLVSCTGSGGGGGSTPAFAVSTTTADFGVVGSVGYSSTLLATGGTLPYTWTDLANELPPLGLALDPLTGVISGTPTATTANAFTATFQVTDSVGRTASGPVTLRIRPRTDRASVDVTGNAVPGSSSTEPSISRTNGRFIAFSSSAPNLVPGVTGNQVYVHDRQTGQATLISQNDFGVAASAGASTAPSISADGRYVAFVSTAANLVAGVSGQQIYLRDGIGGTTTLISQNDLGVAASAGANTAPSISADGRYVAFVSTAANLVASVSGQQIYLRDGIGGTTTLISQNDLGVAASAGASTAPSISADGRYVAFVSTATNLVAGVSGQQIYLRDGTGGTTTLISQNDLGVAASAGASTAPSINANGRYVAFVSTATNLVTGVSGQQIYLRDGTGGTTTLISQNNLGVAASAGASTAPSINTDGRYVAFVSTATNLVTGVSGQQIYRHDAQPVPNGQNVVCSLDSLGAPGVGGSSAPSITNDGSFVAFSSTAPLISPAAASDVYVRAVP